MEKQKRNLKRVAVIQIEPYLAEYISAKYKTDENCGGVKIPATTDLYFCLWHLMGKRSKDQQEEPVGNLKIALPCRRIPMVPGRILPITIISLFRLCVKLRTVYVCSSTSSFIESCLRMRSLENNNVTLTLSMTSFIHMNSSPSLLMLCWKIITGIVIVFDKKKCEDIKRKRFNKY